MNHFWHWRAIFIVTYSDTGMKALFNKKNVNTFSIICDAQGRG